MRALLVQLAPVPNDTGANARTVARLLDEHPEADLVVAPELFISGYDPSTAASLALEVGDAALVMVAAASRRNRTAAIVGFAEADGGHVANSVACFGTDGELRGCYRKAYLFGADERAAFVNGDELLVVDIGLDRPVGLLVCFDMEFPETARALALAGAGLLVTVAANMEAFSSDHELAARARALDNRRPHIYVNRVGEQAGHRFAGGSVVIDRSGGVVAALGGRPSVELVEVGLNDAVPPDLDYLAQVRPELPVRTVAPVNIEGGER